MTVEEAGQLVARLVAMYPRQEIQAETIAGYCRYLADLDAGTASDAVDDWIVSERFFPTVAELRRRVALRQIGAPPGEQAWVEILHGRVPEHPISRAALNAVGGEWTIKQSERPGYVRKDFLAAYAALVEERVTAIAVTPVVAGPERLALVEAGADDAPSGEVG